MYSTLVFLFSIGGWWAIYHYLQNWNNNPSIVKNAVHFIHALIFVGMYKGLHTQTAITNSILCSLGFYCFDTIYLLRQCALHGSTAIKRNGVYLVHHAIALHGLWLGYMDHQRNAILHIYYLLEYSNFFLYVSYHIIKVYPDYQNAILISECFQFVWYSYFRIVRFLIYFVQIRHEFFAFDHLFIQCGLFALFFLGLFWSITLFKKCANKLSITTNKLD